MNFWKTFLACLLALLVSGIVSVLFSFFVLVGFLSFVGGVASSDNANMTVKQNSILHINLGVQIEDNAVSDPFKNFDPLNFEFKRSLTLNGAISKIKNAANDSRINGIFLEFPLSAQLSADARFQLREALTEFKNAEKFVIAYSDAYSQSSYYLASIADMVYVNPQGGVEWKGISMSVMMYKNLLEKLGIKAEVFRHGKFKGAVEPFILDKISEENRLQMAELGNSIWTTYLEDVSKSRSISVEDLQKYANELKPEDAIDAQNLGFVDSLTYLGAVYDHLATLSGSVDNKPNLVKITDYNYNVSYHSSPNKIAVLYAVGDIVDGGDPNSQIVGTAMREEIAKLADNENVKAVVLRVNSPGGSAMASEVILNELQRLKAKKPLVVSMGDYAASGGYYISCFGDKIIADPTTLTGSIGVFGLMFNVEKGAKDILGVNVDVINTNTSSDLGNMFRPITEPEKVYIQKGVENVYNRFVELVATGRNLNQTYVDSIAQGRVWSGVQAKELGLVDDLGTLGDAIKVAAELAGVEGYNVSIYPKAEEGSFGAIFREAFTIGTKLAGFGDSPEVIYKKKMDELAKKQGVLVRIPYQIDIN